MDLSPTHLHLLLNHFPTIGFVIGIVVYTVSLVEGAHHHLRQAALVILVGVAILAIPTYATGNAAQQAIATAPGVSRALMDMHEGAAFLALLAMEVTGLFAWLALWQLRRLGSVPRWSSGLVLALAVPTCVLVSHAAALGGEIRHVEIRITPEASTEQLGRAVGNFIRATPWAWVTSEAIHFIGLSLVIGVTVFIDLRLLGIVRGVGYRTLDRLLPWAILGFGLNLVTGMLFFVAAPGQYTDNPAFYWKIGFVLLACVNTLYFTFDDTFTRGEDDTAPAASKILAVSALVLWVGVMYWGSMLPFIGNAF